MLFEERIRKSFEDFIKANGGFDEMESNLKDYMEDAIKEDGELAYLPEWFCNDLDSFDGYLIEAINDTINAAKISVIIEF